MSCLKPSALALDPLPSAANDPFGGTVKEITDAPMVTPFLEVELSAAATSTVLLVASEDTTHTYQVMVLDTASVAFGDGKILINNPNPEGSLVCVKAADWNSGLFSGRLWALHEFTGSREWKDRRRRSPDAWKASVIFR